MKLVNGRGQLGECLKLSKYENDIIEIYHTWNFLDKSEQTQIKEYKKFVDYINNANPDKKIVFISTLSKEINYYTIYKKKCEDLTISKSKDNLVIKLPNLVGRGIFYLLKSKQVSPYGIIQFLTVKEACKFIIESLDKTGIIDSYSWTASADAIHDIMEL